MAIGPGKYGAQAEAILKKVGGDLCIVVVASKTDPGRSSFDVATSDPTMIMGLPTLLRALADSIEQDTKTDTDRAIFGPRQ